MPGVPSAEERSALPAGELAVGLAEAYRPIAELTAQAGRMTAQVERLPARVEELDRQARKDSSTSSCPPRRLTALTGRRAAMVRCVSGGNCGRESSPAIPMSLVDDPDESIDCPSAMCCGCGADLASALVTAQRRHQVVGEQLQRVKGPLIRRPVKTESSQAPLPSPALCVTALKLRRERQSADG